MSDSVARASSIYSYCKTAVKPGPNSEKSLKKLPTAQFRLAMLPREDTCLLVNPNSFIAVVYGHPDTVIRQPVNGCNAHYTEIQRAPSHRNARYGIYEAIRETYDGPLSMATDLMVWNITKDEIVERMAVATHEAWSVPGTAKQPPRDPSLPPVMTDYIQQGRINVDDANARMIKEFSEKNGLSTK